MEMMTYSTGDIKVSRIGLGCMRMASLSASDAQSVIESCIDNGINFFDHADIYGEGKSEEVFSKALSLTSFQRENLVIQSKLGIRQGYYDFSKEHIIQSVEGILSRLELDYLDI